MDGADARSSPEAGVEISLPIRTTSQRHRRPRRGSETLAEPRPKGAVWLRRCCYVLQGRRIFGAREDLAGQAIGVCGLPASCWQSQTTKGDRGRHIAVARFGCGSTALWGRPPACGGRPCPPGPAEHVFRTYPGRPTRRQPQARRPPHKRQPGYRHAHNSRMIPLTSSWAIRRTKVSARSDR